LIALPIRTSENPLGSVATVSPSHSTFHSTFTLAKHPRLHSVRAVLAIVTAGAAMRPTLFQHVANFRNLIDVRVMGRRITGGAAASIASVNSAASRTLRVFS
jgi:hypothetical protein